MSHMEMGIDDDFGLTAEVTTGEEEDSVQCFEHTHKPHCIQNGSWAYHQYAANLPDGPRSVEGMGKWPWVVASKLLEPSEVRKCRDLDKVEDAASLWACGVINLLKNGLVHRNDFAGYTGIEHGLYQMELAMDSNGLTYGWYREWRWTEVRRAPLKLMLESHKCPCHVVPCVQKLFSTEHGAAIASLRPAHGASDAEKMLAYASMDDWMARHPEAFLSKRVG